MKKMHRIAQFKVLEGNKVNLVFQDGFEGQVDLGPYLKNGIAKHLQDSEEFKYIHIEEGGGLAWNNGFDLCPNQLRTLAEASKKMNAAS